MRTMITRGTHRLGLATVAVAAAAIAGPALSLGSSAASTSQRHQHFTVVSRDSEGTITPSDFGTSPVQDQQAAEDAPVYRGAHKIGRAETVITITRVSRNDTEGMIECTVKLPGGDLFFNGALNINDLAKGAAVPIVGGTRAYKAAAGTVIVQSSNPARTSLSFDFSTR